MKMKVETLRGVALLAHYWLEAKVIKDYFKAEIEAVETLRKFCSQYEDEEIIEIKRESI